MTLKFYEFTGEYYALIKAFSKEEAIDYYKDNICDIDSPVIQVTMKHAWDKYLKAYNPATGMTYHIGVFVETETEILLIDGSLA
ncbi:hypothetical protein [Listeria booriae]|uniref:hypothetical protein n=1 Tax=Listeria booriae TaxID=1552123 RepID=UPI00162975B4|nr:hypothetical protein [Listeria booriae]MBC1974539.1 hypothetical protein [Listeria booriae]MBC1983471.1 hypothetical protein [Listeria booriae]MBC2031831.1 hypothetical protein [Listeria booriae]